MKILAVGAHPDDIEFGCGGILIKEAKKGSTLKNLVLTKGEAGSNGTPEGREEESKQAAKIMGADIEFLEMGGDCHVNYLPENVIEIARVIRIFKPDIVLTTDLGTNQHPDHFKVGQMTRDACRYARYGGLTELKDLPCHKIKNLYFYPVTSEIDHPDIVIDISDVFGTWVEVMKCHESQLQTRQYIELQTRRASHLGTLTGGNYAQGLWKNDALQVDFISDLGLSSRNF